MPTHTICHGIKEDPGSFLSLATLDKAHVMAGLYTHHGKQLHLLAGNAGVLLLDCLLHVVDDPVVLGDRNGLPLVVDPDLVFVAL